MAAKSDAAAASDGAGHPAGKPRESLVQSIAAFAVLTLVGAGSGTYLGIHLVGAVESALKSKAAEAPPPAVEPRYPTGTSVHAVPPIIANLASPQDVWVRLEASIIFSDNDVDSPDVLAGEIGEDILAYLRTLSLEQLQGPTGLLHLHEDLTDRVAIRSDDRVEELIIETLVVQ